jgi:hypothetical protein
MTGNFNPMIYGLNIIIKLKRYIDMMVLLYMNYSFLNQLNFPILLEFIAFIKTRKETFGLAQILLEFADTMENHLNGLQKKM